MEKIGRKGFLETALPGHSMTLSYKEPYTAERQCECGAPFQTWVWTRPNDTEFDASQCCPECQRKRQEEETRERRLEELEKTKLAQREKWQEQVGITGILCGKTFDNFDSTLQQTAYDAVKGWTGTSMVLLSPGVYGIGKTHLACALANHLITTKETAYIRSTGSIVRPVCPCTFITERQLLSRIRQTYNRTEFEDQETEQQVYRALAKSPLLIIDDVGKVRPRDYSFLQGVYFDIVDERWVNEQQIILTTNLSLKELEEHIGGASADRLREMCSKAGFVVMKGQSYRRI